MLQGFKDFIARGNVIELAVAVVIGAAFTKVVDSLVNNLINPIIGLFGTKALDGYQLCIKGTCGITPEGKITGIGIGWGAIIGAAITFILTAAAVYFFVVAPYNHFRARMKDESDVVDDIAADVSEEVELLREIRDALTNTSAGRAASPKGD